jgi:hypothetical protein
MNSNLRQGGFWAEIPDAIIQRAKQSRPGNQSRFEHRFFITAGIEFLLIGPFQTEADARVAVA